MLRIFCNLAVVLSIGCQTNHVVHLDAPEATVDPEIASAREEFLGNDNLTERLLRLMELENQALQLAADEPLKLGSIGAAILEIYYGSQTGHYVMSRFYDHVGSEEAKQPHDDWLAKLQEDMASGGDGSRGRPFSVMTIYDGHTYAHSRDLSPVGSIYQATEEMPFGALVMARKNADPVESLFFDMSVLLPHVATDANEGATPWPLVRELASQMDTAAQTAIGAFLTNSRNFDAAVGWLRVASRSGNMIANSLLARIYWTQAESSEDDEVRREKQELSQENHLHAVALGSTESMYMLAHLYLEGHFGEDNTDAALALLNQAGGLEHADSLLYLGHLYNIGQHVTANVDQANGYFQQAAALEDPQAVISYGRFLVTSASHAFDTGSIVELLETQATAGRAEAMVVLGNLHARGVATQQSNTKAVRWYKKAIKVASHDADIVNEVAWTLTVSDVAGLKRTRYAKRIMDSLMNSNKSARERPEYLDTWAATYAASGNFGQALNLQEKAIDAASNQERDDVMDILKEHLELFRAGSTITEKAP